MQLTTDQRMHWMDILRGFAMILVLAWHAPAIPALLGKGVGVQPSIGARSQRLPIHAEGAVELLICQMIG